MKVLVFGATGTVGPGVLRECLKNPAVERVRCVGKTESALRQLPLKGYRFRPGRIRLLHGIRYRTPACRWMSALLAPWWPLLEGRLPRLQATTRQIGRAMIRVACEGAPHPLLEPEDIHAL